MDMFQVAKRFDLLDFEQYNFTDSTWDSLPIFKAQLKSADKFLSIYHRPTRKRMLYCAPDVAPTSTIIRVKVTGEIFIVGAVQSDSHANVNYRVVYSLNKALGYGRLIRKVTSGPSNNPGWAVDTEILRTFVDAELRSLDEREDNKLYHYGHYILNFPAGTLVEEFDTFIVDQNFSSLPTQNLSFYIFESYHDSGMVNARAVLRGDERVNVVYKVYTGQTYVNQQTSKVFQNRNVTGRLEAISKEELGGNVTHDSTKLVVSSLFLGDIVPKLEDELTYNGKTYRVVKVYHDPLKIEWHIVFKL